MVYGKPRSNVITCAVCVSKDNSVAKSNALFRMDFLKTGIMINCGEKS
jgi:hypothetical protein